MIVFLSLTVLRTAPGHRRDRVTALNTQRQQAYRA